MHKTASTMPKQSHISHTMGATDAVRNTKAVLGPTNTGKTHYAIERMLAHRTGMIGLPLRLLAREVYNRVCARVPKNDVALVTGEERIIPKKARYWIATVEAMPQNMVLDFVAIDEIQTATDFERGHVFTHRLLKARGTHETLLLGAQTMGPVISALLPGIEIIERPRLSELFYAGSKKITRVPPRSAIIAFSAQQVYAIAELVRRERGGAAIVMGALSPRTRNAQVELYQNGEVDILVATDAIGMGLNLDIQHVAFSSDTKFDGRQTRPLSAAEMGQIAGRAGRHTNDGTFGVTSHAPLLDEEMVARLQNHEFDPVKILQWRNSDLDYSSPLNLRNSLEMIPDHKRLTRVPVNIDQRTLETLMSRGNAHPANSRAETDLLWQCCQIPDYRGISLNQHADIVSQVFTNLIDTGNVNNSWLQQQVNFCDNMSGDIDTLSNRIKQIRTWTFLANKKDWLNDQKYWQHLTTDIENRLSDALHERLTRRFVDKRTSILIRHLRDKRMTTPEISPKGEITLEGQLIGTIEGFRFKLAKGDKAGDQISTNSKGAEAAAATLIAPEIVNRARKLAATPNDKIVLTTDGFLRWKGEIIAELTPGDDIFSPRIIVLADQSLTGPDLDHVQDRLNMWLKHLINTQLEQIIALRNPVELEGAARGVAFQLSESFGILSRQKIANDIKGLDQELRGKMRRLGIRFGAYHIYLPLTLKPAPRELALILYALKHGGLRQPGVSDIPAIVLSGRTSFEINPEVSRSLYEVAGFKVAGKRAVRVDILERLADIIRPLISFDSEKNAASTNPVMAPEGAAKRNGFEVTVQMTSLLGCAGDDFSEILKSLGYRVERKEITEQQTDISTGKQTPDTKEISDVADLAKLDDASPKEVEKLKADTANLNETTMSLEKLDETAQSSQKDKEEAPEPKFEEIWFPVFKRNQNHAPRASQDKRTDKGEGKNSHGKNSQRKNPTRQFPNKNRSGSKPNRPREKPIDPDSPFAALAALKLQGNKK
ncbi:MAG: helicase [Devosiaceae bacterium]|nr:helicase [Devosiaceae bacterium]